MMTEDDQSQHSSTDEGRMSTDQMRQSAGDWSLANDTGLRKYLEGFANKLEAKSLKLQKALNELERRIDTTNTSIGKFAQIITIKIQANKDALILGINI